MKKAFTLVEMLIVVVVLVTLMSITFRLSATGEDQSRRNATVARLQRLENCLSGYYAAYGTYPPVNLHGDRNYNLQVNNHAIQSSTTRDLSFSWYKEEGNHGIGEQAEIDDWKQVKAACLAQPVAVRAPVPDGCGDLIVALQELARERLSTGEDSNANDQDHKDTIAAGWDDGYSSGGIGRFTSYRNDTDWRDLQLFQFGLLSYLLPRYQVMMGAGEAAKQLFTFAQWTANNSLPMDPLGAGETFSDWDDVRRAALAAHNSNNKEELARLAYIPSQAVCARWLPNLEKSCCKLAYSHTKFYGIDVLDDDQYLDAVDNAVFAPGGGDSSNNSQQYMLGGLTICDGWQHEIYYYSREPYQSYVVWSAGKNGRTFPPWVDRQSLNSRENKCVSAWIEDDIVHLSN